MHNTQVTQSRSETQKVASDFASSLRPGTVVALHGELGSGKTIFVQGVGEVLGITQRIISPTFILMREYNVRRKNIKILYHIDLYRLEKETDIRNVGLGDVMKDKKGIVFIEWAEKMEEQLPKDTVHVYFKQVKKDVREIKIVRS